MMDSVLNSQPGARASLATFLVLMLLSAVVASPCIIFIYLLTDDDNMRDLKVFCDYLFLFPCQLEEGCCWTKQRQFS